MTKEWDDTLQRQGLRAGMWGKRLTQEINNKADGKRMVGLHKSEQGVTHYRGLVEGGKLRRSLVTLLGGNFLQEDERR